MNVLARDHMGVKKVPIYLRCLDALFNAISFLYCTHICCIENIALLGARKCWFTWHASSFNEIQIQVKNGIKKNSFVHIFPQ